MPKLVVKIAREPFGTVSENGFQRQIDKFRMVGTLTGEKSAVEATVISYGATLVSLLVPDSRGALADVVLGFDTLEEYERQDSYIGATVGRNASRVAGAEFTLHGRTHKLVKNAGGGHLHGGLRGFDKHVWAAEAGDDSVTFTYLSRHGEEGYPGDVVAQVTYRLTMHEGFPALSLQYRGLCTCSTPLNMTNHSYFNLAGHGNGTDGLRTHDISINSDKKLVIDGGIANGEFTELEPAAVAGHLAEVMLEHGSQIDDIFVLPAEDGVMVKAATLTHRPSGRAIAVFTNQPALVVYTANHFPPAPGGLAGKDGALYPQNGSIALETSGYPNAVNVSSFPSVILKPGDVYGHRCAYQLCS